MGSQWKPMMDSEIARLVYGYLKNGNCSRSCEYFLTENADLQQLSVCVQKGLIRSVEMDLDGKGLIDLLNEFSLLKFELDRSFADLFQNSPDWHRNRSEGSLRKLQMISERSSRQTVPLPTASPKTLKNNALNFMRHNRRARGVCGPKFSTALATSQPVAQTAPTEAVVSVPSTAQTPLVTFSIAPSAEHPGFQILTLNPLTEAAENSADHCGLHDQSHDHTSGLASSPSTTIESSSGKKRAKANVCSKSRKSRLKSKAPTKKRPSLALVNAIEADVRKKITAFTQKSNDDLMNNVLAEPLATCLANTNAIDEAVEEFLSNASLLNNFTQVLDEVWLSDVPQSSAQPHQTHTLYDLEPIRTPPPFDPPDSPSSSERHDEPMDHDAARDESPANRERLKTLIDLPADKSPAKPSLVKPYTSIDQGTKPANVCDVDVHEPVGTPADVIRNEAPSSCSPSKQKATVTDIGGSHDQSMSLRTVTVTRDEESTVSKFQESTPKKSCAAAKDNLSPPQKSTEIVACGTDSYSSQASFLKTVRICLSTLYDSSVRNVQLLNHLPDLEQKTHLQLMADFAKSFSAQMIMTSTDLGSKTVDDEKVACSSEPSYETTLLAARDGPKTPKTPASSKSLDSPVNMRADESMLKSSPISVVIQPRRSPARRSCSGTAAETSNSSETVCIITTPPLLMMERNATPDGGGSRQDCLSTPPSPDVAEDQEPDCSKQRHLAGGLKTPKKVIEEVKMSTPLKTLHEVAVQFVIESPASSVSAMSSPATPRGFRTPRKRRHGQEQINLLSALNKAAEIAIESAKKMPRTATPTKRSYHQAKDDWIFKTPTKSPSKSAKALQSASKNLMQLNSKGQAATAVITSPWKKGPPLPIKRRAHLCQVHVRSPLKGDRSSWEERHEIVNYMALKVQQTEHMISQCPEILDESGSSLTLTPEKKKPKCGSQEDSSDNDNDDDDEDDHDDVDDDDDDNKGDEVNTVEEECVQKLPVPEESLQLELELVPQLTPKKREQKQQPLNRTIPMTDDSCSFPEMLGLIPARPAQEDSNKLSRSGLWVFFEQAPFGGSAE